MLKRDIITWIKQEIRQANHGWITERPCLDGLESALKYLEESPAASTTTAAVPNDVKVALALWKERREKDTRFSFDRSSIMDDSLLAMMNYIDAQINAPAPTPVSTPVTGNASNLNNVYMPEEPTDEMAIALYGKGWDTSSVAVGEGKKRYKRLRALLTTPPKPKTKTVWCSAHTYILTRGNQIYKFNTEQAALDHKEAALSQPKYYTNVSPVWSQEEEV